MKLLKRILAGLLIVIVLAVLGFVAWAESPLPASSEALLALESDASVTVARGDFISFSPADGSTPSTAFVFYPGGRVDARAYARPLRAIAGQGYLVILVPVRLNLAFFDIDAAGPVLSAYPQVQHWVIGGHSLGGVAASLFAGSHPQIEGLVFWASYPANAALRGSPLRVLSIYGTRDMAGVQKFEESRALLPAGTQFIVLDGGNHSQFGDYGLQPGDNPATLSRLDQQSQVVEAVTSFLASFSQE